MTDRVADDAGRSAPRRRLRTRIAWYIAATVAVALVISAVTLLVVRDRTARRSMEKAARTYTRLLAGPLVDAVQLYRSSGQQILAQQIGGWWDLNGDLVQLVVVDVDGRLAMRAARGSVETFPRGGDGPRIAERGLLDAIGSLRPSAGVVKRPDGGAVYRVVAPAVEEWGRHTYSVIALFSYSEVNQALVEAVALTVVLLGLAMVLAAAAGAALAATITSSLDRLHEGVQRVRRGGPPEPVDLDSDDEIQDLAEAFNRMIGELNRTIERLRDANRELETLDQTKADLLANVSHELKTPLTALRGYLELLSEGDLGRLPERAARAVGVCRTNLDRLSERIEELMQLGELERSAWPELTMDLVGLGALLEEIGDTFLPRLAEAGVAFSLDAATDLPRVWGNRGQLERVFLNLLDNAAKFTGRGGAVRVEAAPSARSGRTGVLVRVVDTGPGIPEEEHLRIFDRFYQVDPSTRRRHGGMGLGLAVVRNVVESHRGAIWVDSELGRGAAFNVWLPCDPAEESGGHRALEDTGRSARLGAGPEVAPPG